LKTLLLLSKKAELAYNKHYYNSLAERLENWLGEALMPLEIFFCYAREDEELRQGLEKQLRALRRQGIIDIWYDREISPGKEWEVEIDKHLKSADIILLLVSSDFMDSDYCYGIELRRAMQRHERGEAVVIPIILRPVYWQGAPFGKLQALPTDGKPVIDPSWHYLDRAFYDIAEGIRTVAIDIMTKNRVLTRTIPPIDEQIALWLAASTASNSPRTTGIYKDLITRYRTALRESGLDLDTDDASEVVPCIEHWAATSGTEGREVAPNTYNHRLSVASSFYKFAYKHRWIKHNPLEWIERREEITVNEARALEPEEVQQALKSINRTTLQGKRDYALLHILFRTGRYVNEVAAMRCGDIAIGEYSVTVTFPRCKGGEVFVQELPKSSATAQALLDYLNEAYGDERDPAAPVWRSVSMYHANKGLHAIGAGSIGQICQHYLGTSKVYTTRKTWLKMQEGTEFKGIEKMLDIV
jgi:integrase